MSLSRAFGALAAILLLSACAGSAPEQRGRSAGQGRPELTLVSSAGSASALPSSEEGAPARRDVLGPYLSFIRRKEAELSRPAVPESERRIGRRALLGLQSQVYGLSERILAGTSPETLFERCWREASAEEREEAERARLRDAKLEEYWRWARWQWGDASGRFYRVGTAYLVTEPPLREASRDLLTRVVLDWAFTHTDDPAFLQRSPSEVALYLLARNSVLATAVESGQRAAPHVDYTPELDPTRYTAEELAVELTVGFIPGVGQVAFALEAATGVTLTGHQLEDEERVLIGVLVLLPYAGTVLARTGETLAVALERTALITGHSLHEAEVLARVASRLSPGDVAEIERLVRGVAEGRHLNAEELARLNQIAGRLEVPLAKLGELVRQGGKGSLLGTRVAANGVPLTIGSAEHLAQCWIDYQFRYPGRYKRFSYAVDPAWEKLYRGIIENKQAGGEFEKAVLEASGYRRNVMPMMPPPGSKMAGFIADAVKGNPEALVWGKPYNFVEVKNRAEMALTGNLKAMIDYVETYGGHLEVWFRSEKHIKGATKLTKPLRDTLKKLKDLGNVEVKEFPE